MLQRSRVILACSVVLAAAAVASGAEEQAAGEPTSAVVWLIVAAPLFFLILWLLLVSRKSGVLRQGGYMSKADAHIDLANEHMLRNEQKMDRMIELLESIDRKLGEET